MKFLMAAVLAVLLLASGRAGAQGGYQLMLLVCLVNKPAQCTMHTYGEVFQSKTACMAASQPLAASFLGQHPEYGGIAGIMCRTPKPASRET
jgi:hypothetical protein